MRQSLSVLSFSPFFSPDTDIGIYYYISTSCSDFCDAAISCTSLYYDYWDNSEGFLNEVEFLTSIISPFFELSLGLSDLREDSNLWRYPSTIANFYF